MSYRRHPLAATVEKPEDFCCWVLTRDSNQILELEGSAYLIWRSSLSAVDMQSLVTSLCQEFDWDAGEAASGIELFVEDLIAREVLLEEVK